MTSPLRCAAAVSLFLIPVWAAGQDSGGFRQQDFPAPSGYRQNDFPPPSGYRETGFPAASGYRQNDFPAPNGYRQTDFGAPTGFKQNDFPAPTGYRNSGSLLGLTPPGGPAGKYATGAAVSAPAAAGTDLDVLLPGPGDAVQVGRFTIVGANAVILPKSARVDMALAVVPPRPLMPVEGVVQAGRRDASAERRASNRPAPKPVEHAISAPEPHREPPAVWSPEGAVWDSSERLLFLLTVVCLVALTTFVMFRFFPEPAREKAEGRFRV